VATSDANPIRTTARYTNAVLTEAGYDHVVAAVPGHVAAVRELVIDAVDGNALKALQDGRFGFCDPQLGTETGAARDDYPFSRCVTVTNHGAAVGYLTKDNIEPVAGGSAGTPDNTASLSRRRGCPDCRTFLAAGLVAGSPDPWTPRRRVPAHGTARGNGWWRYRRRIAHCARETGVPSARKTRVSVAVY